MPKDIYKEYSQWLSKYEKISKETCIICGKPGRIIDNGWILPYFEEQSKTNK